MAVNDIGRVTPIWRGIYSAERAYELNDIVLDAGGSVWWHVSEEITTGTAPAEGETWAVVIDMRIFGADIQRAIEEAQAAVREAEEARAGVTADADRAETAAENAETYARNASESAAAVGAYAQAAEEAKTAAQTAASGAQAAQSGAESAKTGAQTAQSAAETAKIEAQTAATQAAGSAETASGAAAVVEQKKTEAVAAVEAKGAEVLASIPEDYTELSKGVEDLKESFDDLNEFCRKVVDAKTKTGTVSVTSGTTVPITAHIVDMNIPAGSEFTFTFDAQGLISFYTLYADGANIRGSCVPGTTYTLTAENDISYLSIYAPSNNVIGTGTATGTATIKKTTENSLEQKTDDLKLNKFDRKQADTILRIVENSQTVASIAWEPGLLTNGQPIGGAGSHGMRTSEFLQFTDYITVKNDASSIWFYIDEYDGDHAFLERNAYNSPNIVARPVNANCAFIKVQTYSTTIPENEQAAHITIAYVNEKSIADLEEFLDEFPSMFEWMTNGTVKYHADEMQINDHTNNDSGSTTYVYKALLKNVPCTSAVIVSCDSITNARADSIRVYFIDANNNRTELRCDAGIHQFTPPEGTVAVSVNLYPSASGGMSETTAVYENVYVWFADTQKIIMSKTIDITGLSVPYYYLRGNYLDDKISTIEGLMAAANGNYDAFIFCTDQHWELNAKNSPKLMKYICDRLQIKRLFMGGDYFNGISINALYSYRNAFDGNVYNVTGNHEYMNRLASMEGVVAAKDIGDGDIWAYLNMGMKDEVIGNAGRNYYYVDNPVQKMRYIILNVYADNGASATEQFESAQQTWLSEVALNLPSGYTAVIFAHYLYSVNYDTGAITISTSGNVIAGIVDAYSGDGEIACLVAGHTHVDGMTATSDGIPVFITTCDKYGAWIDGGTNREPWLTENRIAGTITEQAFDVVVVDKANRLISFVRIGAPADNGTSEKLEIRQQSF